MKKIRPKGTFSVSDQGNAQVPKEIREELQLNGSGQLAFITCNNVAVVFNPKSRAEDIIKSIEVLLLGIEQRIEEVETDENVVPS